MKSAIHNTYIAGSSAVINYPMRLWTYTALWNCGHRLKIVTT